LDIRLLCWRGCPSLVGLAAPHQNLCGHPKEKLSLASSKVAIYVPQRRGSPRRRNWLKHSEVHKTRDRVVLIEDTRVHMSTIIPMLSGVAALVTADSLCG
jgi:hypothetical protein